MIVSIQSGGIGKVDMSQTGNAADKLKSKDKASGMFADLMNLLLCFFVLLFSMSTVDAKKFDEVVASFNQTFSIFTADIVPQVNSLTF